MSTNTPNSWSQPFFNDLLVDLGDGEAEGFRGVLTPKAELGQRQQGVNAVFFESAETYDKKYQGSHIGGCCWLMP
jgi:hypothetical protein